MEADRKTLLSERSVVLADLNNVNAQRAALIARLSTIDGKLMELRVMKGMKLSHKTPDPEAEPLQSDPFDHESEQIFLYEDQQGCGFRLGRRENGDIIAEGTMPELSPGWEFTTFRVMGTGVEATGVPIHNPPKKTGTSPTHLLCVLDQKAKESFNYPFFARKPPDEDYLQPVVTSTGENSLAIFRSAQGDVEIQMISKNGLNRVLITIPEEKAEEMFRKSTTQ